MRRKKKIFRPKRNYHIKRRNRNAVKIAAGIVSVAALVFVGYSAAGPIGRYIADRPRSVETEPWTPEGSESSEPPETSADNTDNAVGADMTLPPVQTDKSEYISSVSEAAKTGSAADLTEQTPSAAVKSGGAAYSISKSDMQDRETLKAALDELAASGCSAVIFPMKTEGGVFRYKTAVPFVQTVYEGSDPVVSDVAAAEIAEAAESRGLRPVALISVLNDNNRYGDYREGSYHTLDDDAWLDSSPEKGGKPWLSPFESETPVYLCDIVSELANAGFKDIICDDFIFPEFRSSDIELLGEKVSPYSDRYLALTSLAVKMTEAGREADARVMLRITANSVVKRYSELFYPEELAGCTVMIDYSENNISRTMVAGDSEVILDDMEMYEKITAVYGEVVNRCGELSSVPMIERGSMSADEFGDAVKALTAMGYDEYYVY
ncbi:MAG: hypothetical protein NC120_04790 [Ruminococcus sp.]|nr:hypothetical protein [Ruminococcus sp.]